MLQMMVFEQYGIPKEHNHLWYDKSHGFWDFPPSGRTRTACIPTAASTPPRR